MLTQSTHPQNDTLRKIDKTITGDKTYSSASVGAPHIFLCCIIGILQLILERAMSQRNFFCLSFESLCSLRFIHLLYRDQFSQSVLPSLLHEFKVMVPMRTARRYTAILILT